MQADAVHGWGVQGLGGATYRKVGNALHGFQSAIAAFLPCHTTLLPLSGLPKTVVDILLSALSEASVLSLRSGSYRDRLRFDSPYAYLHTQLRSGRCDLRTISGDIGT